jgi:hypothetical protein
MQPSHARALHAAGLTSPDLIGRADEQAVAEALAAAMRTARPAGRKGKEAGGGKRCEFGRAVAGASDRAG